MDRRSFISGLSALVGGLLLDKAVPLGRVYSFPKEIKCLNGVGGFLQGRHYDLLKKHTFIPASSFDYAHGFGYAEMLKEFDIEQMYRNYQQRKERAMQFWEGQ